jgi:hypothetical protein
MEGNRPPVPPGVHSQKHRKDHRELWRKLVEGKYIQTKRR